uniref:Uncharacterized protein n=1 Tax=Ciona intestinalis TaxID=7719 RepID=H2XUW6_CIOIN
ELSQELLQNVISSFVSLFSVEISSFNFILFDFMLLQSFESFIFFVV